MLTTLHCCADWHSTLHCCADWHSTLHCCADSCTSPLIFVLTVTLHPSLLCWLWHYIVHCCADCDSVHCTFIVVLTVTLYPSLFCWLPLYYSFLCWLYHSTLHCCADCDIVPSLLFWLCHCSLHCCADVDSVCWDRQHDAQECLMTVIDKLHEDINKCRKKQPCVYLTEEEELRLRWVTASEKQRQGFYKP